MTARKTAAERRARGWVAAGLATALALTTGGAALRADQAEDPHAIEGVWLVQVTLRDCSSGAPAGLPFPAVVTFHEGGTVTEATTSGAFAIGQRTPAQGTWASEGRRRYTQSMISLIAFATAPNLPGSPTFDPGAPVTPGFLVGSSVVSHTLELTDADHLVSSGTNAFLGTDGTVYRTGCSTATGTRFR